jgi:Ran GTPase-activating protein (RanGAP) involved in mRNA processing and transport/GTPase SAR1 family protein
MKSNETVTSLDISENWISQHGTLLVADLVKNNTTINSLNYSGNKLGGWTDKSGLKAFCGALQSNRALQTLDLSGCNLLVSDMKSLTECLESNPVLISVDLSGNVISQEGKKLLAVALLKSSTTQLGAIQCDEWKINQWDSAATLSDMQLGFEDIALIGAALKVNGRLTSVMLNGTKVDPSGKQLLGDALLSSSVSQVESLVCDDWCITDATLELDLCDKGLQTEDAALLAGVLKYNTHLISLNLSRNAITGNGGKNIAEALTSNKTLQTIDLSGNALGEGAVVALAVALRGNTAVTKVNLTSSGVKAEDAQAIGDTIEVSCVLKHLDLSNNELGDQGACLLVDSLNRNKTFSLDYIGLNANGIDNKGGQAICTLVPGLVIDCLGGNSFNETTVDMLQERERSSNTLVENSAPQTKVKLHLCGESGVGKTKLKKALSRYSNLFNADAGSDDQPNIPAERTRGIDISLVDIVDNNSTHSEFAVYDYGGLRAFHHIHDWFLASGNSIFMVVSSLKDPPIQQAEKVRYWLRFIRACAHTAGARVILVGSRRDQINRQEGDERMAALVQTMSVEFRASFQVVAEGFPLDCRRNTRTTMALKDLLVNIKDEIISADKYLTLYPRISSMIYELVLTKWRHEKPVFSWSEYREKVMVALHSTISHDVLVKATVYLNDTGEVIFTNAGHLSEWVILNPQWLCTTVFGKLLAPSFLGSVVMPFHSPDQLTELADFKDDIANTDDTPVKSDYFQRLHDLLTEHRPDKVSNIPSLLDR